MLKNTNKDKLSEKIIIGALLGIVGGFLDAYTYVCRGEVFANAQTGNIVRLSLNIFEGNWDLVLTYFLPIVCFTIGIFLADYLRYYFNKSEGLLLKIFYWRQLVLLLEICLLVLISFMSQDFNHLVTMTISIICGMQVETFRKFEGNTGTTTMCTGNLRQGTENICDYVHERDRKYLKNAAVYFGLICFFSLGVMFGAFCTHAYMEKAILVCAGILCMPFLILFKGK